MEADASGICELVIFLHASSERDPCSILHGTWKRAASSVLQQKVIVIDPRGDQDNLANSVWHSFVACATQTIALNWHLAMSTILCS